MTSMDANRYTDGRYLEDNPQYHVEDSPWKAAQVLKMLARHPFPVRTVAEVGCGAGEILRQLQLKLPPETTFAGYEISPQAITLARTRENDRLWFHQADLLATEVEPFDLLLCMDVFEHVEDYIGFIRRLRAKARQTVFHIPLDLSVQSVLRMSPIVRTRATLGHLHYFTKETALLTLRDAGYEVVDSFFTAAANERGQSAKAKLARLPRALCAAISPGLAARLLGGYSLLVLAR